MNLDAWKPYTDEYGLIHDKPGNVSGNCVRYTAEFAIGMATVGISPELKTKLDAAFSVCQIKPGLLIRHPSKVGEREQVDDYYGALAADQFITGGRFARNFLWYGRNPENDLGIDFTYNNINPKRFEPWAFHGRQQPLIALAQYIVNEPVPLWRRLIVWAAILHSAFRNDQDGKVLAWFVIKGYEYTEQKDAVTDLMVWIWRRWLAKHYPGGIGHVLEAYYGPHPNAELLKGEGLL